MWTLLRIEGVQGGFQLRYFTWYLKTDVITLSITVPVTVQK